MRKEPLLSSPCLLGGSVHLYRVQLAGIIPDIVTEYLRKKEAHPTVSYNTPAKHTSQVRVTTILAVHTTSLNSPIFTFSILPAANMSLKAVYERFLAGPTLELLAPDVSLHYITTTTTISRSEQVINHLAKQSKVVKKKSDKILSVVEGTSSLCLDVEITLEFVSGGGAYLLALDDNFLTDRAATFPMVSAPSAFGDS